MNWKVKNYSLIQDFLNSTKLNITVDELYIIYLELETKGLSKQVKKCPTEIFDYIVCQSNFDFIKYYEFQEIFYNENGYRDGFYYRLEDYLFEQKFQSEIQEWISSHCDVQYNCYFNLEDYYYEKLKGSDYEY